VYSLFSRPSPQHVDWLEAGKDPGIRDNKALVSMLIVHTFQGQQKHFSFGQVKYSEGVMCLCRGSGLSMWSI